MNSNGTQFSIKYISKTQYRKLKIFCHFDFHGINFGKFRTLKIVVNCDTQNKNAAPMKVVLLPNSISRKILKISPLVIDHLSQIMTSISVHDYA